MKALKLTVVLSLTAIVVVTSFSSVARAERERPIVLGQTEGFAGGDLVIFDYGQNFICANAPLNNADCQVGPPGFTSLNLPGVKLNSADIPDLIVIAPFFTIVADDGCAMGPLGALGCLEAFDPDPEVFVQCPEKQSSALAGGTPFGQFGHCIFHDTMLQLTTLIPGAVIPLPNHTHIVAATPGNPNQPWDTKVVLVTNPALWPNANGVCSGPLCLTSFDAVAAAADLDADGNGTPDIIGPVDTTLVLFFGVHGLEP